MFRTYGNARLYSDRGLAVLRPSDDARVEIEFVTAFERGGPFEFSFSQRWIGVGVEHTEGSYRIAAQDGRAAAFWPDARALLGISIDDAVTTFAGISFGAAVIVPRLLMSKQMSGQSVFEPLAEASLGGREIIDDEMHDVVLLPRRSRRAFVSPDGLIRRMDEIRGDRTAWVIDYEPILTR